MEDVGLGETQEEVMKREKKKEMDEKNHGLLLLGRLWGDRREGLEGISRTRVD